MDYIVLYQDCSMSLYTLVNEKVGSLLSQGMGYVSNTIGLVRNYTTLPLFQGQAQQSDEPFDESGKRKRRPTDASNVDTSKVDASETPVSTWSASRTPVWEWTIWGVGWIAAIFIASLVANEMILLPWQMRVIGFLAILVSYSRSPFLFCCVLLYYMYKILYNTFSGAERKFPYIFAVLPIRTAKEGDSGLLYWFTYFKKGVNDPLLSTLNDKLRPEAVRDHQNTFPKYAKWTGPLAQTINKFKEYMDAINATTYEGPKVDTAESVAKKEAEELLEDESTTDFERVGKARGELEEASKGLSKGLFGASKAAKEAADMAEVKLELAKRKFAAQKDAEKVTLSSNPTSNEAKQIQKTHDL